MVQFDEMDDEFWLGCLKEVIERCRVQAAIIHDTPAGINAAVAASLMTHYCPYRLGPKAELAEFLALHVEGPWTTPWQGRVGPKGMMSVRAALTAVVAHHRHRMINVPSATEVLGAMITPAVLISVSGTLVLSTSNRLNRVVDRVRVLAGQAEQLRQSPAIRGLGNRRF